MRSNAEQEAANKVSGSVALERFAGVRFVKRSEANGWYVEEIRRTPKRKPWCRGPLVHKPNARENDNAAADTVE